MRPKRLGIGGGVINDCSSHDEGSVWVVRGLSISFLSPSRPFMVDTDSSFGDSVMIVVLRLQYVLFVSAFDQWREGLRTALLAMIAIQSQQSKEDYIGRANTQRNQISLRLFGVSSTCLYRRYAEESIKKKVLRCKFLGFLLFLRSQSNLVYTMISCRCCSNMCLLSQAHRQP